MAPEVITANDYTEKADVYSYGIVLVELYTGQTPFSGSRFKDMFAAEILFAVAHNGLRPEIPGDCPRRFAQLIEECLEQDPAMRPSFTEITTRLLRM
jgi:serine/threonine protein kinase